MGPHAQGKGQEQHRQQGYGEHSQGFDEGPLGKQCLVELENWEEVEEEVVEVGNPDWGEVWKHHDDSPIYILLERVQQDPADLLDCQLPHAPLGQGLIIKHICHWGPGKK